MRYVRQILVIYIQKTSYHYIIIVDIKMCNLSQNDLYSNENRTLIPAENIPKGSKILKRPLIIEKSLQYYSVYQNVQIIN